jgi:hypothetical protein
MFQICFLTTAQLILFILAESSSTHSKFNRKRDTSASGVVSSVSGKHRRISVEQPLFDTCQENSGTPSATQYGIKPATPLAAKIITFMDDV